MKDKLADYYGTVNVQNEKWIYVVTIAILNKLKNDDLVIKAFVFKYVDSAFDDGNIEKFIDDDVQNQYISDKKIQGGYDVKLFEIEDVKYIGETVINCFFGKHNLYSHIDFNISVNDFYNAIKLMRKDKAFFYRDDLEDFRSALFKQIGA